MTGTDLTRAAAAHLADATVLVKQGSTTGTAFFLKPGLLATCRHVVGEATPDQVRILHRGQEVPVREIVRPADPDLDAALLAVDVTDHPVVQVRRAQSLATPAYAYGYQFADRGYHGYPALGAIAGFVMEGTATAQRQLLQIVDATIAPGLSGAALFSIREQCVVGIVKRSRPEGGGYATPIEAITELRSDLEGLLSPSAIASDSALASYFKRVLAENEYVALLDLQRSLKLDEIFVSLTLTRSGVSGGRFSVGVGGRLSVTTREGNLLSAVRRDKGLPQRFGSEQAVPVSDVLAHRKSVIIGEPGCGKTTLLRHITRRVAQGTLARDRIPLFVRLADLRAEVGCFEAWIRSAHGAAAERLLDALESGTCLLLLDGLDELPRNHHGIVAREIERLAAASNQVVLSCRSVSFPRGLFPSDVRVFECIGFSASQQSRFLRQWFAAAPDKASLFEQQIRNHAGTAGFGRNPLLLSLMAVVAENDADFRLPLGRPELYERALNVLLERRMAENRMGTSLRNKLRILRRIAAQGFENDREVFPEEQLLDDIDHVLKGGTDAEQVLRDLVEVDGVLALHSQKRYRFLHLTFQEYLTARQHADGQAFLALPEELLDRERWEEVVRLVAGMLPLHDAARFVDRLIGDAQDPAARFKRLLLAARACSDCQALPDGLKRTIATALIAEIGNAEQPLRAAEAEEALSAMARTHAELLEKLIAPAALQDRADLPKLSTRSFIRMLGRIGGAFATELLLGWHGQICSLVEYDEQQLDFFAQIAEALGQAGLSSVADSLLSSLDSPSNFISAASARCLAQLNNPAIQGRLEKDFAAKSRNAKLLAVAVLCSVGDDASVARLMTRVFTAEDHVVQQAFVHHFNRIDVEIDAADVASIWDTLSSTTAVSHFLGLVRCFRSNLLFHRLRMTAVKEGTSQSVLGAAVATLLKLDSDVLPELFGHARSRLAAGSRDTLRALLAFVPTIQAENLGRLLVGSLSEADLAALAPILFRFALTHRVAALRPWLENGAAAASDTGSAGKYLLALAATGSPSFTPKAAAILSDRSGDDMPQRIVCYRGLGLMNTTDAQELLAANLLKEKEPSVISEVVVALGLNPGPKTTAALARLLDPRAWPAHWPSPDAPRQQGDQRPSDRRRVSIVHALEQSCDLGVARQLEALSGNPHEEAHVREAALMAARNIRWEVGSAAADGGP